MNKIIGIKINTNNIYINNNNIIITIIKIIKNYIYNNKNNNINILKKTNIKNSSKKYNLKKDIKKIITYSKGKGFCGTIKRYKFSSNRASHGNSKAHNKPGSIGKCQTPGRILKGKKMAGRKGNNKIIIKNPIIIYNKNSIIIIKGIIPGNKNKRIELII